MRSVVALLLVSLVAAAPAVSAPSRKGPKSAAILPVVGRANDDDRRAIDAALRSALRHTDTIELLSPVETRQHLLSFAEMGLVCDPEDVPCLVKLGLVSNVAWVIVPVVDKPVGRSVGVEIGVIDVGAAKRTRTIEGTVSLDDAREVGDLARRAMGIELQASSDEPKDQLADPSLPAPADPVVPPAPGPGLSPGVLVAGIGGAVAAVSLISVTFVELAFSNVIPTDTDTRKNIQPLGAVLWATTALGAVAVGAGIYLWSEEPEP